MALVLIAALALAKIANPEPGVLGTTLKLWEVTGAATPPAVLLTQTPTRRSPPAPLARPLLVVPAFNRAVLGLM
jgi:hypothetical protein